MRCPSCSGRLSHTPLPESGLEIDVCHHCGATWFDRFEFEEYLATRPGGPSSLAAMDLGLFVRDQLPSQCPRCVTLSMDVAKSERVIFGRCEACEGVFIGPRGHHRFDHVSEDESDFAGGVLDGSFADAFPLPAIILAAVFLMAEGIGAMLEFRGLWNEMPEPEHGPHRRPQEAREPTTETKLKPRPHPPIPETHPPGPFEPSELPMPPMPPQHGEYRGNAW